MLSSPTVPIGKLVLVLSLVLATAFGAALITFVRAAPVSTTVFPRLETAPAGPHVASLYRYGVTVRASSVDWPRLAHPGFAIDGDLRGARGEHWAPDPADESAWLEVELGKPTDVAEARVHFAGATSTSLLPAVHVACESKGGELTQAEALPIRAEAQIVALSCRAASRIRLELDRQWTGNKRFAIAELEVLSK